MHQHGTLHAIDALKCCTRRDFNCKQLAAGILEYYHPDMSKNDCAGINWIIITLLVMLPLRGVIAIEQSTCDMHDRAAQAMHDHGEHSAHLAGAMSDHDDDGLQDCCCCDSDRHCITDCGIGAGSSFIAQSVLLIPSTSGSSFQAPTDNTLVFRALSPPIRPPAYL